VEQYNNYDLVIINDETNFSFYSSNDEKIIRNITFKINSEKGLEQLSRYTLPESFDQAYDAHYHKQGRAARIKSPFIYEYTLLKYGARKLANKKWVDVVFDLRYEKIRWVRGAGASAGEFLDEDLSVFNLQDLAVGDVVQIVYEAAFNSNYGNNLFYFHSVYPKIECTYTFKYRVTQQLESMAYILPLKIHDSCITRQKERLEDYALITDKIKLKSLSAINYPANSFEENTLPHVFADFQVYRKLNGSYPSDGGRIYDFELYRPKNFDWVIFADTNNTYTPVYNKQYASLRKFITTKLPPYMDADSTYKTFFKALCDTFNNFRYLSSNHLFYNESNLSDIYSGDHLLKRRLVEHLQWKIYTDILNEGKIFYSIVNVQDKRFGEHNPFFRSSYAYERKLIAIPQGDSYIYFMPRYQGMKYHLNELPFYLEGTLALLNPMNFQTNVKNKEDQVFKFIKTHQGTFNENTRTENVSMRITLDSMVIHCQTKESLSGQFSTVLRHYYLNNPIDSTISPFYFKKCTDKPLSHSSKIKLSSNMSEYPFRYNFNSTSQIGLPGDKHIRMKNWFSFIISSVSLPERPEHDYFFDFDFSDGYNFLLNFKEAVEIVNLSAFEKKINNAYFELESKIVQNFAHSYLVQVKLLVKQRRIPRQDADLLMALVKELDTINNFSLELVRR
jgi:hypothetical protein